ncbi:hypothetical protein GN958_ATG07518 [Phytophthora infestans]|uniref:Uncharacterized protein n=1 Tax=Phytophthora infestans TaxID=4787 RepID=A0A8S9UQW6_PHYIN|nr:hypothetical protein GN958_ATG07518 [Phytophthora infestans]
MEMEKTRARVEVKIGEFGRTSRTSLPVEDAEIEFDEVHDSFDSVYLIAERKVSAALAVYFTKTTRPDMKLYMKPTQHAKQSQLAPLSAKEVRQGIRRATPARIAAAATAIDSYLTERSDVQVGDMVRTHWAIRQARQPEGAEVSLPSNATFRQMQHLDAMRSPGREGGHQEGGFRTLTVRLNVSSEMQLTIDIQEALPRGLCALAPFSSAQLKL